MIEKVVVFRRLYWRHGSLLRSLDEGRWSCRPFLGGIFVGTIIFNTDTDAVYEDTFDRTKKNHQSSSKMMMIHSGNNIGT